MALPFAPVAQYGSGERAYGLDADQRRRLKQPRGLHIAADGSLFVADFGAHCVVKFKPNDEAGNVVAGKEGKILSEVDPMKDLDKCTPMGPADGEGYLLKRPAAVCEGENGGLYVMDMEDARVLSFAPGAGSKAEPIMPAPGAPPGKSKHSPETVKYPRSMFIHEDGTLVICDSWSHRVLAFPAAGKPGASESPQVIAGTPMSCGKSAQKLSFPSFAAFRPDGALLVTDTNNHRVQCFQFGKPNMGVTVAGSWKAQRGDGLQELNMPTGICVDPNDGSFYVADRGNSRVLRFPAGSTAGTPGEVIAGPELLERPWDVRLDSEGSVYISDERLCVVYKLKRDAIDMRVLQKKALKITSDQLGGASTQQENDVRGVESSATRDATAVAPAPLADVAGNDEALGAAAAACEVPAVPAFRLSQDANELD